MGLEKRIVEIQAGYMSYYMRFTLPSNTRATETQHNRVNAPTAAGFESQLVDAYLVEPSLLVTHGQ